MKDVNRDRGAHEASQRATARKMTSARAGRATSRNAIVKTRKDWVAQAMLKSDRGGIDLLICISVLKGSQGRFGWSVLAEADGRDRRGRRGIQRNLAGWTLNYQRKRGTLVPCDVVCITLASEPCQAAQARPTTVNNRKSSNKPLPALVPARRNISW